MKPCFSQHRGFEYSRLIYMAGKANRGAEVATGKDAEMPSISKLEFDSTLKDSYDHWVRIDDKYGKTAYQKIISDYARKLIPSGHEKYRTALVQKSTKRYMKFYERIYDIFLGATVDLEKKFDYSVNHVVEQTESDLKVLMSAVEGSKELIEFNKGAMPSPEDEGDVEDYFGEYLYALNGRYFNADVNEGLVIPGVGIPGLDRLLHPDLKALPTDPAYPEEHSDLPIIGIFTGSDVSKGEGYKAKSREFQQKMENWVEAKLKWLLKQKDTNKQTLVAFKNEITSRYKRYSTFDSNSAIISSKDFDVLIKAAKPPMDAIDRILDEDDDTASIRLELVHLLNPDAWNKTVEKVSNMIIQDAIDNGSEKEFTKTMNKYRPVQDFGEARGEFLEMLWELSKVGAPETMKFLTEFNISAHGDVLEFEQSIDPNTAFGMQVSKQLDYLLKGSLVPQKEGDKMLVRFINASRGERNDILANDGTRDTLFRAIKLATVGYPEIYKEPSDKPKRSKDIEKPSSDDRAAQLQALIILGNQSQVIVSKLNRAPEHRGKNYKAEIDKADMPDTKAIRTGLRFKSPSNKKARFQSALASGGFNTRDLALKGAKLFGLLTVAANVSQSFSETEGDFVDRLFKTAEKSVTNHGVLAGVAVTVGAYMAERNPAFLKYPWLSQHERTGAMIAFKLDNISARLGRNGNREVKRFTHNDNEWRALSNSKMDSAQIKELLQEAGKRAKHGQKPLITVMDIKRIFGVGKDGLVPPSSPAYGLTTGGRSARMRYLFYSKFFSGTVKPDVHHVKELCTGTGYIPKNTVKTKKA